MIATEAKSRWFSRIYMGLLYRVSSKSIT